MRRIRHLSSSSGLIKVGQKIRQILSLCGQGVIVLERTWHKQSRPIYEINAHVVFNTDSMNGLRVIMQLEDRGDLRASANAYFRLNSVSESSWSETLIDEFVPTEFSPGFFSIEIPQSQLGGNELSGLEVYSVEMFAWRKRTVFTKKLWFNHLGVFDSIWRLRRQSEASEILKLDE